MMCSLAESRLLAAQQEGIARLKSFGLAVKVNTVVLYGVNDDEVVEIARQAASQGADLMNLIPHIPVPGTRFGGLTPPHGSCAVCARNADHLSRRCAIAPVAGPMPPGLLGRPAGFRISGRPRRSRFAT